MAGEGLFNTDCVSSSLAWLDPGCLLTNAGADVGSAVTSALEPVWIILGILFVFVLLIGIVPNLRGLGSGIRLVL